MADFFFFTDIDLLQNQSSTQAYGPAGIVSGVEKFRVSSMHSATGVPNAYAICDGVVCIQPDTTNTSLVNLILKPNQNPDIIFSTIKYIIYKGILKSSLLDGAGNVAIDTTNDLTQSIKRSWDAFIAESGEAASLASEKSLGIDLINSITNYADSDPIDNLFYLTAANFHFPSVNGGWVIGKFDTTAFGLTIITERIGNDPKLKLVRNSENFVEVPVLSGSATNAQTFEYWHNKEDILNFIDPCAFYGMFYPSSLKAKIYAGSFTKNSKNEIYDNVLKGVQHTAIADGNFFHRNTIYLDIRNEHNQSFNYYKNYGTDIEIAFDDTTTPSMANYYQNTWPIYIISNSQFPTGNTNSKNEVCITLPIGDNPNPLAVILNGYVKRFNPFKKLKGRKRFISLDINGSYTEVIKLLVPNRDSLSDTTAICHHVLITYTKRLEENPIPVLSTGTKIETNYYFDNLFFPLDMKSPFNGAGGTEVKVYNEGVYIDQVDTGREFLAHTAFATDAYGVYYFLYANDRKVLFGFKNRKFYSFNNEHNLGLDYFLDLLVNKYPHLEFKEAELTLASTVIQTASINNSFQNIRDKSLNPHTEELSVFYLDPTNVTAINNLITANNLMSDYKISLGFTNPTLLEDDTKIPFKTYDVVLKGFVSSSSTISATEINTNIKIYQYVS